VASKALVDAAFVCDLVLVRDLLALGANPNVRDEDGRTPLFSAVLGGSLGLVGLLIESGAEVNARDSQGFTPLHYAAQEDLLEMARLLIAKGADVNAQDEDGSSVLWRAVFSERGRRDLLELLLASGGKPDLPNRAGETPRALADRLGSGAFSAN
jgi:ankyrin repeat protein